MGIGNKGFPLFPYVIRLHQVVSICAHYHMYQSPIMHLNRLEGLKRAIHTQRNCLSKESRERLTELANTYTWKDANDWQNVWQEHKYFQPKDDEKRESFKMILPPPNVTGVLHLGHALTCTIQDVLARWQRMNGKSVLWVPGLDHAGIATQVVVEKYLRKTKGIGRYDLGKDHFVNCMKEWKDEKGDEIRNQLRALGTSLDWSREFFTMSKEHNEAVTEAFLRLNQRRLLYRNKALINWSPTLCSAISDMEIEHVQVTGKTELVVPGYEKKVSFGLIAKVAFKLRDSEEQLSVATTRVETLHGDVAIAVNPEDSRYSSYIGRQVWHPLRETFIPIISDSSVHRDFGTGAVKITPAHDHADLEVAKRHNLETIDVIGNDGKMTINAKSFQGLPRFLAREKILNELMRQGALKSLDNHEMLIPVCSRSGDIVEYLMREQWFMRTKEMAERAIEAVRDGSLKIDPPEWSKVWCDWLGNNRDWCVSRQIWWGHRIPAYLCRNKTTSSCDEWIVARSAEEARLRLGDNEKFEKNHWVLEQDQDVLDTWFSSALLPLSAVGWPDQKFEKYYPLNLMVTGHDIIFLWVARMVMLGLELTNTLPFKEVLLHGVLCDVQGKKMSKSRGNVIRPEHIINGITLKELNAQAEESCKAGILNNEELKRSLNVNKKMFPEGIPDCGTDALRLTLCSHNVKTSQVSFNVIECRTNKHFCNKIWQATKYVLRTTEGSENLIEKPQRLSTVDRWILSRLSLMVMRVNDAFEEKNFYKAVLAIKQFFYYEFCDFFLEATKPAFKMDQREIIESHRYSLARCLEVSLRILAPITPYLSDHLYSHCAKKFPKVFLSLPSLVEAPYPKFTQDFQQSRDSLLEEKFDQVLKVITAMRNLLAQVNDKSESRVHIVTDGEDKDSHDCLNFLEENINIISAATRVQKIEMYQGRDYVTSGNSLVCGIAGSELRVFLLLKEDVVDLVKERIEKKRLQSEKKLENLLRISRQPKFAAKPEGEKLREREKVKNLEEELKRYPKFS